MPEAPPLTPSPSDPTDKLPKLMGVVNVTPDSFSDGGSFLDPETAITHAHQLVEEGADLLDIGGESTRPGSDPVSSEEEIRRVVPVIEGIRSHLPQVPMSIDTSKASVAAAALTAGANIVNDVTAGRGDTEMLPLVAEQQVEFMLMHMQGNPKTMQRAPVYQDVVAEVEQFFQERIYAAEAAGIPKHLLTLDPGVGFGKTLEHNLEVLRALPRFKQLGCPLLLGVSRKRWIGDLTGSPVNQRLAGSLAGAIACMLRGADLIRVHDVRETRDALRVADAILGPERRKG